MKKYGLIGEKLGHSFSKSFFEEFFLQNKINAVYENHELATIEQFTALIQQNNFAGLNVTIPYKQQIIPFLDHLSPEAEAIGAVNCIQFHKGKMIGHNTDVFGFHQSIKPFLRNIHERAIILGTDGASKAVSYVLENLGIRVIYLSRDPKTENEFHYNEANQEMIKNCKLIVNTTPLGTFPDTDQQPDFPVHLVNGDNLVVDLIYNPAKTKFLQIAEQHGAQILNGETMLKQQALKSWEIWRSA